LECGDSSPLSFSVTLACTNGVYFSDARKKAATSRRTPKFYHSAAPLATHLPHWPSVAYNTPMLVLLFDIDGTLISTGGAGKAAMDCAFTEEFQLPAPQDVPFSGRTDRGIARNLFSAHGIDDSVENFRRFCSAYLRRLPDHLQRLEGRVLPGVSSLLDHMTGRSDVVLGLLTGNVRDGARIKLEHYNLFHYFAYGGFGDHHTDRDDVARDALAATHEHLNGNGASARIWVIGDTPLDVRCARAIGARCVAVATGTHDRGELAASEPDVLCDDLADSARLLQLFDS
jgi:phosphoglycolate phosphatase